VFETQIDERGGAAQCRIALVKETLMKPMQMRTIVLLAASVMFLVAGRASAQASLASADATAFLGGWELGLDTPQGAMTMELTVKDSGGKVQASISAPPVMPQSQEITDISNDKGTLILKYVLEVQGMQIPAVISIIPDGDKWKANFDFAGGQFNVDGTATKK
jgi:hypothetical protein